MSLGSLPGFVDVVAPQDLDGNPSLPEEHILGQVLVVPQINSAPEDFIHVHNNYVEI